MRSRFVLAAPVLVLGLVVLFFAATVSPDRASRNAPLVLALAHPPKHAAPVTTRFIAASRKVEREGFVRRRAGLVRAKGWVSIQSPSHGEDGTESGKYRYFLHARGKRIELQVGQGASAAVQVADREGKLAFQSGEVVQVTGRATSSGLAVQQSAVAGARLPSPALGPVATLRPVVTRKVAIVRFYTPDHAGLSDMADPATDDTLNQFLNGTGQSLKQFYLQLSNNRLNLEFTIFKAVQVPASTTCDQSSNPDWLQPQVDTGTDSLNNYDLIVNLTEFGDCPWAGGGDTFLRNSYMARQSKYGALGVRGFAHELGHNLGLAHANAAVATNLGAPVAISKTWTNLEYADNDDVMGSGYDNGGMDAPELARLGLLPLDRTLDINPQPAASAQPVTLGSVDQALSATSTPRLLRIRRPSVKDAHSPDAYLYIDLRQSTPGTHVDEFGSGDPIVNGVAVRFGPSYSTGSDSFRLLDSSPGRHGTDIDNSVLGNQRIQNPVPGTQTAGAQDFFVAVGQSMYDPIENLTISNESVTGGQATVRVIQGPPPGNATSVSVSSGRLFVTAGAGRRNNVILSEYEGRLIVTDVGNSVTVAAGCTQVDAETASCSKTAVKSVSVRLDATGDAISDLGAVYGDYTLPVIWDGGDGKDTLEGGPEDDTFRAGPGGSTGSDADLFTGGGGNDRVDYSARTATQPVVVTTVNGAYADGGSSEGDQVSDDIGGFTGGAGNDVVKLNAALPQSLDGGPGTDSLSAGSAADTIVSRDGGGGDAINCGGGADKIYRDAGDTLDASCPAAPAAPQLQITSGPDDGSVTNAASPTFNFLALYATGITFVCKLENGTTSGTAVPGPCTSVSGNSGTYAATSPTEGDKVFTVVETIAGVSTSLSRTFRVDRTAPTVSITSAPPATTDASASNFAFGFSDSVPGKAQFECSLDNAATWTSCAASVHYPDLATGTYRLMVRAVDAAGNVSPTQQQDWTIAPDTILDSATDFHYDSVYPGTTHYQFLDERPAFSFHATSASATVWCKIDSGAWAACSSATVLWRPTTPLDLSLSHTIQIAAGNATEPTDTTPLSVTSDGGYRSLNTDTKITSGPTEGSVLNAATATFGFDAYWWGPWRGGFEVNLSSDVRRFECRVNTRAWVSCDAGTYTATGLPQGTNNFSVRAVRWDGQRIDEDWTPPVRTFTVDTVAPTITFTSGPANGSWIAGPDTSFGFTANETGSTFECQVDSGAYAACTSPMSVTGLSKTTHLFRVRATDPAGNTAISARTFDVGLPHATFTGGPSAGSYSSNATPTFTFTATHTTATFECTTGTGSSPAYTACTSPWTAPAQPAGAIMFRVRAKLPTGQVDATFDGRLVTFDYTAPAAPTVTSGPAAGSTVTTDDAAFGFSAAGETSPTYECKLDTGAWAACTSPTAVTGLPNGPHTWSVHSVDRAGNVGANTAVAFTVTKPKVLAISDPAPASPTAVSLTVGAIDWVQWNGTTPTALSRKTGVNKISTWAPLNSSQPNSLFAGPSTFSWTDAAGTATGSGVSGVATGAANGRGFRFTIPATDTATRTLKVYVGLRGVSVTDALKASFSDGVAQQVNLTSTSDTAIARVYTLTFRPTKATDTLTVDWWQGGGGTKSTALAVLYAATLS